MSDLLFDTCFLMDLERELRRGAGKAHAFLAQNAASRPWITWIVAGEFAEGFGDIHHAVCAAMLQRFDVLPMNEKTAGEYARITRSLRSQNQLTGTNDLWIAAAAVAGDMPLVTSNGVHFSRITGLSVMNY